METMTVEITNVVASKITVSGLREITDAEAPQGHEYPGQGISDYPQIPYDQLVKVGVVPKDIRHLYLLCGEMSDASYEERKRIGREDYDDEDPDNDFISTDIYREVSRDKDFAGREIVWTLFNTKLACTFPETAPNEYRGHYFYIDTDWSVYTCEGVAGKTPEEIVARRKQDDELRIELRADINERDSGKMTVAEFQEKWSY